MQIVREPKVTVLSTPHFNNPEHFPFKPAPLNIGRHAENLVEFAARLCYMSFGEGEIDGHRTVKGRDNRDEFFTNIKKQQHGSVLEHANFSVLAEGISRSLTHEWVRHRAGWAYSQLSQRFVKPEDVAFVLPPAIAKGSPGPYNRWVISCTEAAENYSDVYEELMRAGYDSTSQLKKIREAARSVLPNCTETKLVATANARSWRHFFAKRGALGADAEFRRLAIAIFYNVSCCSPLFFNDITIATDKESGEQFLNIGYQSV